MNKQQARQGAAKSKRGYTAAQRARTEANKIKRKIKHMMKNPNDKIGYS